MIYRLLVATNCIIYCCNCVPNTVGYIASTCQCVAICCAYIPVSWHNCGRKHMLSGRPQA